MGEQIESELREAAERVRRAALRMCDHDGDRLTSALLMNVVGILNCVAGRKERAS